MTRVLDDKGRVFGFINIIDALVAVLIIAAITAGTALVFDHGSAARGSVAPVQEVTYRINEPTYIASHLAVGLHTENGEGEITAVENIERYHLEGEAYRAQDVTIAYTSERQQLRIGAERTLRFDAFDVTGSVVSWREVAS